MAIIFPVAVGLSFVIGWGLKYFFTKSNDNDGWRVITKEDPIFKEATPPKIIIVDPSSGLEVDRGQKFLTSSIEKSNLVYYRKTKNGNTGITGWGKPSHNDINKFVFFVNAIVAENTDGAKELVTSMISSASQLCGTKVNDIEIKQVVLRVAALSTEIKFYQNLGFGINAKKSSEQELIQILEKEVK